jgi:small subunit ribosomal protein S6
MRVYESTIAFHPEAGEVAAKDLLERARQALVAEGAEVRQIFDWGIRDLAYPIRKQRRAAFHIIEFNGNGRAVAELERNLRIFDPVLRYITVQVDPNRPPLEVQSARRDGAPGELGAEDAPMGGGRVRSEDAYEADEPRDEQEPS